MRVVLLGSVVLLLAGCGQAIPPGAVEDGVTTPASASATPYLPPTDVPGDGPPPNHADNNAWKQRNDVAAADRSAAEAELPRVQRELAARRAAGEWSPAQVRAALEGLGHAPEAVSVLGAREPLGSEGSAPGASFGVRVGGTACVVGDVTPARLLLEVKGAAAEYGCLEPFSH